MAVLSHLRAITGHSMDDIQVGDIYRANGKSQKVEVLLVKDKWVWIKPADGTSAPMTITVTTLRLYYNKAAPFDVGDKVEFHTPHTVFTVPGQGKVLAIHEDRAWCLFPGRSVPLSPLITSLKKVN